MASEGKGAVGAAGFGLLALLAGMGRFADDCGRVAARGASHASSGIDDVARLGRYGDEAAGLGAAGPRGAGLLDDVDPWRSLNAEGATRRGARGAVAGSSGAGHVDDALRLADTLEEGHWLEWGQSAVELGLEFAPDDDPLGVFSGEVTVTSPRSLEDMPERLEGSSSSVFVVTVERDDREGRAATALAIATACKEAGRYCIIAVSSSGRHRAMASSAFVASYEGIPGLLGRLQQAAQDDGGTFLYRAAPDEDELRLIEFRPQP